MAEPVDPAVRPGAPARSPLRSGPGRVLVFVYGVLALAATGRSAYQLVAKFDDAPLAYLLSAVAALIYVVAFVALLRDARVVALVACSVELVGVLAIGTLSYAQPDDFPDSTVWSGYGNGYGYLPLLMPVLALVFLGRRSARTAGSVDRRRPDDDVTTTSD